MLFLYICLGVGIWGRRWEFSLRLYADNLKCVSRDPEVLLGVARFTTGYVRLVGQELAPSKCVLMSTSRAVRSAKRGWVVSDEGHPSVVCQVGRSGSWGSS